MAELMYKDLTEKIIKIFLEVYNLLGYGYSKDIYLEAMYLEMKNQDMLFERNIVKDVIYKDIKVGEYKFDFVNEDKVLLYIATVETLTEQVEYILVNHLKSTKYEVGLILNFGKRPEVRRKIFQNARKSYIKKGDTLNEKGN
jgi:GxxExxY protein